MDLHNTQLRFGSLVRGRDRIFIQVVSDGNIPENITVSSVTDGGDRVPSQIFWLKGNEIILCLPVVHMGQWVSLSLCGQSKALAKKHVFEYEAALISKVSTYTKGGLANRIRNIDEELCSSSIRADVIIRADKEYVVRGRLELPAESFLSNIEGAVQIALLNLEGRLITANSILMGGHHRYEELGEMESYIKDFSFRVPASELNGYIVWAYRSSTGDTLAFDVVTHNRMMEYLSARDAFTRSADSDPSYARWFEGHRATLRDLEAQHLAQKMFDDRPLISIIVPLFRTPLDYLRQLTDSVLNQSYPHFELLFVNASPEDKNLCQAISDSAKQDSRIKIISLDCNKGITENTNAGIRAATGEFLAFVDHDDLIEPDALYWYVKAVNEYPQTDLIYCDEDRLKGDDYILPFFKPDWDIDLLCGMNYVCHMLMVRKGILEKLQYLPTRDFDGAQDHNMSFVVGEAARNVHHVRRILYHWRLHEESFSGISEQKNETIEAAQIRSVQDHLNRCGIPGHVVMGGIKHGRCSVDYEFARYPSVSIIIPNKNALTVLHRCVESLMSKTQWPNFEVVIVENGSDDPNLFSYYNEIEESFQSLRIVTCETNGQFNFSKLINLGARASSGEYLLLLNNDTEIVQPNWLHLMMSSILQGNVGCVGAKLLYPDDTVQHMGVATGRGLGPFEIAMTFDRSDAGYFDMAVLPHQQSSVTGACLLTSRVAFDSLNGFDESFPNDYNDIDYCLRLREAGYSVVMQQRAVVRHYHSTSRGREESDRFVFDQGQFAERWPEYVFLGDPFYSANFGYQNSNWGLCDWR